MFSRDDIAVSLLVLVVVGLDSELDGMWSDGESCILSVVLRTGVFGYGRETCVCVYEVGMGTKRLKKRRGRA